MWLANTDIANAARSVVRRVHDATREDWKAVTKILGYLPGTNDHDFKFTGIGGQLMAYTDSNDATDPEGRRSVSGWGDSVWGQLC